MTDTRLYVQTSKKTLAGGGCSSSATSITLNSFKHLDGTNISMADFGTLFWMTLEPGTSREEIISVAGLTQNASGTCTLTSVTRGLKTYSAYASGGTAYAHAGGAIAIVTNNPQMYDGFANKGNDETITGLWDFSTSIPTLPASNPSTSNQAARKAYVDTMVPLTYLDTDGTLAANSDTKVATQKATKTYADALAIAGSPNASTTAKGIVEEATQAEYDARTATGGTSARLFVNPSTVRGILYNDYAADAGANDTYTITVTPAPTAYVTGQVYVFKANTVNTGAATLNVNSLGAKTIVKNYNVTLTDGDIKANQIVEVVYDGTNFQLLSPISSITGLSNGATSRDLSTASGTQTIAHGLGVAPRKVDLFVKFGRGTTTPELAESKGQWVSGYENCIFSNFVQGSAPTFSTNTTSVYIVANGGTWTYSGLVTVDATNITITWTKGGSPSGSAIILWEAQV